MFFPTIGYIVYCYAVVWSTCERFLLVSTGWTYFSFPKAVINKGQKETQFKKNIPQKSDRTEMRQVKKKRASSTPHEDAGISEDKAKA